MLFVHSSSCDASGRKNVRLFGDCLVINLIMTIGSNIPQIYDRTGDITGCMTLHFNVN